MMDTYRRPLELEAAIADGERVLREFDAAAERAKTAIKDAIAEMRDLAASFSRPRS